MRMHRILAATAAVVMVASGAVFAGTAPASAANVGDLVTDDPRCIQWTSGSDDTYNASITGYVGDTFTVTFTTREGCRDYNYETTSGTPTSPGSGTLTLDVPQTFTIVGSGVLRFRIQQVTVVGLARPAASPIPAWVQAYGRDKDATCLDGWDASWQSWAEPVTGGWVCTRSIPSLG